MQKPYLRGIMATRHPSITPNLSEMVRDVLQTLRDKTPSSPDQEVTVALPAPIFSMLVERLQEMVTPQEAEISTKEAATLLQVSRPYLVKLLDEGKIPFRKVGVYRRVRTADVLAYKETLWKDAKEAADALTQQAQDLDMGY